MKAVISRGTPDEFSWGIDEPVTPELVNKIEISGDKSGTDWFAFEFYEIISLLREKYSLEDIEEMLYDEDPEIIEIGSIILDQSLLIQQDQELNDLVRLYFPVMQVIVRKIKERKL